MPNINQTIKKIIQEILNEEMGDNKGIVSLKKDTDPYNIKKLTDQGLNVNLVDEMARNPILYKLSPDYKEKLVNLDPRLADSKKRMRYVKGIIDFINTNGESSVSKIAHDGFGLPQQRLNDYANVLVKLGILEPTTDVTPQFMKPDDEIGEPKYMSKMTDPEDLFVGKEFDDDFENGIFSGIDTGRGGGEEPEVAKSGESSSLSDDDYEAFMKYGDLKQRLDNTILNIKQNSRKSSNEFGEKGNKEVERLNTLKKSLEQRINDLVSSSPYLQNKLNNSSSIDEIKRMQKLANIKK